MLPAPARMRSAEDFRRTVREGKRVGRPTLVVHAGCAPTTKQSHPSARVGFVVAKTVGSAVGRNRVKRRLRHLARERLSDTPTHVHLVVRALPAAATVPARLARDFDAAWTAALSRLDCS